ncbi:integrase arm-type DNA-binding domain-containing protein [Nordella sp. HKS 07]|uniref:tyrosine-type recombinase/integrase n=1 Tax=Nordella sp. HKS 07 TaxID=2712222 RepID=UPI0013E1C2E9|nr:site-specific integrase [Nordella sp. HKS 07]QIG47201.1 integrase arm-type DNA-binding domain-containing protein [Nordella sp. HKS 07]
MVRKMLTDRGLKALKSAPPGKRQIIWDAAVPGFGIRITDRGHHSFVLCVRYPGSRYPTPKSLGDVGSISLEQARNKARQHLELIQRGIDPKVDAERRRQAELRKQQHSFESVAEAFIAKHVSKLRTADDVARDLRNEFVKRWGKRPISEIDRHDVAAVIEAKVNAGAPYRARTLFAYVRKLFGWAAARGTYGIEVNPCSLLKPSDLVGAPAIRQRILTEPEWRVLWKATGELRYPLGDLVRVLALTGARLREISEATWSEVDFDKKLLTLAPERMKADAAHVIPLTDSVIEIFKGLPSHDGYLFKGRRRRGEGDVPVSGFSKMKRRLDALMLEEIKLTEWRVHDIRRSMRTGLSALGVQDRIAEMTIGHRVQGLHKVYDLHSFLNERREALKRWEKHLLGIVEPRPNVVPFLGKADT